MKEMDVDESANVLEQVNGLRVLVEVDPDPGQPYDDGSSPLVRWSYRSGRVEQVECTSYRVPDSILDAAGKWGFGTDTFRRYLTIFHGATAFDEYTTADYEYLTFDTEDWRRAMGLTPELLATNPDVMRRIANLDEWRAWCEGEVYGWTLQRQLTWRRDDDPKAKLVTWEDVDSAWGYYGREDVESAAREALAEAAKGDPEEQYREDLLTIVEGFRFELCSECGKDLSLHMIGPDPLGHPHAFCIDEDEDDAEGEIAAPIVVNEDADKTAAYLAARLIEVQESRMRRVERGVGFDASEILPEERSRGLRIVAAPDGTGAAVFDDTTGALVPIVPASFPVEPVKLSDVPDAMTCGTCGRSWDNTVPTQYTPAPSGRCPFEYHH